ncbi:MAG: dihydrofolate reductase family protein [Angustibacter sp.]
MGSVVMSHFITLDGVVEAPHEWMPEFVSAEELAVIGEQIDAASGMLVGRRTYAEFASYWPAQGPDVPLAERTNSMRKYVVGHQPAGPVWEGTTFLDGDPIVESQRLVDAGEVLVVPGSMTLCRALLAGDVVDELHLIVAPVLRGRGRRLLHEDAPPVGLEVISRRTLPLGVEHVAYRVVSRDRS